MFKKWVRTEQKEIVSLDRALRNLILKGNKGTDTIGGYLYLKNDLALVGKS